MQIEQVTYLKSITIKNKLLKKKCYYLILCCHGKPIVGPVFCLGYQENEKLAACWNDIYFMVNKSQEMFIQLWEYNSLTKVSLIQVDMQKFFKPNNTFTIEKQLFDIEIVLTSSILQNQTNLQKLLNSKLNNKKQFIFPLIKTLDHFPINKQISFSHNLYKSQQSQFNQQFSSIDSVLCSETSLEKIMEFSSQGSKIKYKQEKKNSVQKFKDDLKRGSKQSLLFFDDYEARPKRKQKLDLIKQQKLKFLELQKKQNQKQYKQANSTASSSLVKKNLKNTIQKLTQIPLRIHQRQRKNYQHGNNISRQWLIDYGLIGNKRSSKIQKSSKNSSKIKDISTILDSPELRSFCEKSLSKQEIQNVQNLNSLQLSQSILQQYGLDLSSAKINSKSTQKTKLAIKKSSQSQKQKKNKIDKISQKISAFNVEYKFQDYGQQQINKNSKKVK